MVFVGMGTFAEVMELCNPLVIKLKRFSLVCNYTRNTSSVGRNKLLVKCTIFLIS
jgi:hypothetical protein